MAQVNLTHPASLILRSNFQRHASPMADTATSPNPNVTNTGQPGRMREAELPEAPEPVGAPCDVAPILR